MADNPIVVSQALYDHAQYYLDLVGRGVLTEERSSAHDQLMWRMTLEGISYQSREHARELARHFVPPDRKEPAGVYQLVVENRLLRNVAEAARALLPEAYLLVTAVEGGGVLCDRCLEDALRDALRRLDGETK